MECFHHSCLNSLYLKLNLPVQVREDTATLILKKKGEGKDLDMMSKNCISNVLFCMVALVSLVQAVPRIVDLSHRLNNASLTWPGNPPYQFTLLYRGFYDNSWFV